MEITERAAQESVQSVHTRKANTFLPGGRAHTMSYHRHTQYCTGILGHHRGGSPASSNSFRAKRRCHWLIFGQSFMRSSLIPRLTKHCAVTCLVSRATWPCIWSVGGVRLSVAMPDGRALITVSYVSEWWAANAHFWSSFGISFFMPAWGNDSLIRETDTADQMKGKFINLHSCFRQLHLSVSLSMEIDYIIASSSLTWRNLFT